jgi:SAM-dependent methyltransferase
MLGTIVLAIPLVIWHFAVLHDPAMTDQAAKPEGVALFRREASALEPHVNSRLARNVLQATADLPAIAPRTLYLNEATRAYFTEREAQSLDRAARTELTKFPVDESFYYTTKYGTPLAYARPLDLLGRAGVTDAAGLKVLDFGFGTIGHLRLLASLGADVTGVDVDPLLRALYSNPEDQGTITTRNGPQGRIRLIDGRFPADPSVKTAVGAGYDVILSKNTLKNGFVHPERPVEKRRLLNLDVDDATFVRAFYDVLKPGGWLMIYNICPAPSPPDKPYKHWADGRCPFARPVWEAAGFQVVAYDQDDTPAIRKIAHALGWDRGEDAMDLNSDLFAHYSLMRKLGQQ